MIHRNLNELEEYNPDKFTLMLLHKGQQSEYLLLHLLPGQEVPPHPHAHFEVVLLPQKGEAQLIADQKAEVLLLPGTLYFEEAGQSFGIKNTGQVPFQMLIMLVRIAKQNESETS